MGFDVHDPELDIRASRLLEASAGTGKTYAIEHLFTRLVLLDPPIPFDRIAIITFTKKATQSLKMRLRKSLEAAIEQIRHDDIRWPYLKQASLCKPLDSISRRLLDALFHFDQVRISTIHAFASSMLQRLGTPGHSYEELGFNTDFLEKLVRMQIQALDERTLREDGVLELVKEEYYGNIQRFIQDLRKGLESGLEIGFTEETHTDLEPALQMLKDPQARCVESLLRDTASCFVELCDAQGNIKYSTQRMIDGWNQCVEAGNFIELERAIELIEALQPQQLKKRLKGPQPELAQYFATWSVWLPKLRRLRARKKALENLTKRLKSSLAPILQKDERVGYDVLLRKLSERLNHEPSAHLLAQTLDVLIVDEFQDTDPLQWDILRKLRKHQPKLSLILVGDPKQSIYAFRQADIYTYMQAKEFVKRIGGYIDILDTNYRSHPQLVDALNHLFDANHIPHWLWLPRTNQSIACSRVLAGRKQEVENSIFARLQIIETTGSVRAQMGEIARAIASSYPCLRQAGMQSFAALVNDHKTSRLLQQALEVHGIPCQLQKPVSFCDLPSTQLYAMVIRAWLHPRDTLAMKSFWCLPIWRTSKSHLETIVSVHESGNLTFWSEVQKLSCLLHTKGLGAFHEAWLMSEVPMKGVSIYQWLESSEQGQQMLDQWRSLVRWMHQYQSVIAGNEALELIYRILDGQWDEHAVYHAPLSESSLQILTIHASKGLEYDVVYSIGTAFNSKPDSRWFQSYVSGQYRLICHDGQGDDPTYRQACDELDAEKARRQYVAWTRAKEYLFLIWPQGKSSKVKLQRGSASPMELYMASWQEPQAKDYGVIYESIRAGNYLKFEQYVKYLLEVGKIGLWKVKEPLEFFNEAMGNTPRLQNKICSLDLSSRLPQVPKREVESFSSLLARQEQEDMVSGYPLSEDEISADLQRYDEMGALPKGREIGTFWHEAIERALQISRFEKSIEAIYSKLESWFCRKLRVLDPWQKVVLKNSCHLLNKRWRIRDREFCLLELPPNALRMEKEFNLCQQASLEATRDILHVAESFQIQGVIDAWMIDQGQAIFFDWKSNWLGPNCSSYSYEAMAQNALENRYDWQAHIYSQSLQCFLKPSTNVKLLAGVYVYLRGPGAIIWDVKKRQFEALESV